MYTMKVRFAQGFVIIPILIFTVDGCSSSYEKTSSQESQASTASSSTPIAATQTTNLPEWKSDSSLLDQLDPYQDFEGYQIRVPKGWEIKQAPAVPFAKVIGWGGPMHADGTRQSLSIMIVTYPSNHNEPERPLTEMIESSLRAQQSRGSDFSHTSAETGHICGITFMKVGWKRKDTISQMQVVGLTYVGKDSHTEIHLLAQDAGPDLDEHLKLAQAAILTFQKKQE